LKALPASKAKSGRQMDGKKGLRSV
jgi:hypothetical protein